eukprot:Hpha_TRINITY_DN15745_c4_g3::TRINITY_DN15745_c4_g3_i2::g.38359::m.38359
MFRKTLEFAYARTPGNVVEANGTFVAGVSPNEAGDGVELRMALYFDFQGFLSCLTPAWIPFVAKDFFPDVFDRVGTAAKALQGTDFERTSSTQAERRAAMKNKPIDPKSVYVT